MPEMYAEASSVHILAPPTLKINAEASSVHILAPLTLKIIWAFKYGKVSKPYTYCKRQILN
jgi:hypothetical protein